MTNKILNECYKNYLRASKNFYSDTWKATGSQNIELFEDNSILKIAKLEIVGNEWEELGEIGRDSLYIGDFSIDPTFTIEVINTDENAAYGPAIKSAKQTGNLPHDTEHRKVKYLNNRTKYDHRRIKRLIKYRLSFYSFKTKCKP